ncbi:MAG: hypothetical protein ACRC0A_00505 [Chitinophagaceae bacterium]
MIIGLYIVFIVLLFVVVMQYFQLKDKKKPIPILFLSLFLVGITVVFFVQKNTQSLSYSDIPGIEKGIFVLLGFLFVCIFVLKYLVFRKNRQQIPIDKFWMYQSLFLIVIMLVSLRYIYFIQEERKSLEGQYLEKTIFIKKGIGYADSLLLNPINYFVGSNKKLFKLKIKSMDVVYQFSVKNLSKKPILIPEKVISLPIDTYQDTILFFVER